MSEDFITRKEHEEFAKRIEAEDERQNVRLRILEDSVKELSTLPPMVQQVVANQTEMLSELREKPLKSLSAAKQTAINTIVTTITSAVVIALLLLIAGRF